MGWLSGILSGYADQQDVIRKAAAERDLDAQKTEAAVYNTLLNSDDPKQQKMGATGILQMGQGRKRKGGFSGWMGEMESSPIYSTVQKYFDTPQPVEDTPTPRTYLPPKAGAQAAPLAQPGANPTTGGEMAAPQVLRPVPPPEPPPMEPPASLAALPAEPPPPPPSSVLPPMRMAVSHAPTGVGPSPPAPPDFMRRGGVSNPAMVSPPGTVAAPAVAPSTTSAAPPEAATAVDPTAPEPLGTVAPPSGFAPSPAPATPPVAPPVAATEPVAPATGPAQPSTPTVRYPHFMSSGDIAARTAGQTKQAEIQAEVAGLQEVFRAQGDPDWQKKGLDEYLALHTRGTVKAGRPMQQADGSWVTPWVDNTGAVVSLVPMASPQASSTRASNPMEQMANVLYGKPGEDGKTTLERIQREGGGQMENVMRRQQAFIASAPLNEQEKFGDIQKLQTDWNTYSAPYQTLKEQMLRMRTAWQAAMADPITNKPMASEMIAVTFQKMLDPGSVVRETEARRSGSMQSYIGQFQGWMDQIRKGGANMTMAQLKPYLDASESILAQNETIMAGERQRLQQTADQFRLGPLNLIGFQPATSNPNGPPAPPPQTITAAPPGGNTTTPTSGGGRATIAKKPDGSKTILIP